MSEGTFSHVVAHFIPDVQNCYIDFLINFIITEIIAFQEAASAPKLAFILSTNKSNAN